MEHYLSTWIRSLVGLVFLVSSLSKVSGRRAFDEFAAAVETLAPVPGARRLLAPVVVALEFGVCVLLALPVPGVFRYGAWLATSLLLSFALGIALAVRRGTNTACRCFGRTSAPVSGRQALRNLALAIPTGSSALLGPAYGSTAAGTALTTVIGLTCGALVITLDDIVDLFRPASRTTGSSSVTFADIQEEKRHAPRGSRPGFRRGVVRPQSRAQRRNDQTPAGPGRDPQPQRQV
ncbi:MauE/DoxX family redox-associated membrane protein [Streptomyces cellulosae]|uniref:MauE/DoxX family redox-associated membrane protein n=1 Tax=Streptomyces cellulosae TaxID=1968 RepID=UPI00131E5306